MDDILDRDSCKYLEKYAQWETIKDRDGVTISKYCLLPSQPPCTGDDLVVIKKLLDSPEARTEAINNLHIRKLIEEGLLDARHFLPARQVFVCKNYVYIVTDFIVGMSFSDYVKKYPDKDLTNLFKQIAISVKSLEDNRISHRDMHYDNILIVCGKNGCSPDFMIFDFGASYIDGITPFVVNHNINFIQHLGNIPGLDLFTLLTSTTQDLLRAVYQDENFLDNILPDMPFEEQVELIEPIFPKLAELIRKLIVPNSRLTELIEATSFNDAPQEIEMLKNYTAKKVLSKL